MKTPLSALLLSSLAFVACSKQPAAAPSNGTTPQQPLAHDDHDTQPIGDLTIGAHTFTVRAAAVDAGKEVPLDLEFGAGKPMPGTVRAWIGVEAGTGSMKAKLTKEGDRTLHNHLLAPRPLPEGSRIWVEIDDGTNIARGSIAWK